MMRKMWSNVVGIVIALWLSASSGVADEPGRQGTALDFTVKLETVMKHDDEKFLWFHPRVAAIPSAKRASATVVMTLQKHLRVADYYSGLNVMRTDDLGKTWTKPDPRAELDWVRESDGANVAVCDVTPGWHAPSGKLLAIGARVRYGKKGEQLQDRARSQQTAYAVHNPKTGTWSKWKVLKMPGDDKFNIAFSACAQWLVQPDGTLLLPFYFASSSSKPHSVTVVQCKFDGQEIQYVRHGAILSGELAEKLESEWFGAK